MLIVTFKLKPFLVVYNVEYLQHARDTKHLDFEDCEIIRFFQISSKKIISYTPNTLKKGIEKHWLKIFSIYKLIKTEMLRRLIDTHGFVFPHTKKKTDKKQGLWLHPTVKSHVFCTKILWPNNTPALVFENVLCQKCYNEKLQKLSGNFEYLRRIELGLKREIRIATLTVALANNKNESDFYTYVIEERKIHIMLSNTPLFLHHFKNCSMSKVTESDLLTIFCELKRELNFNKTIPQLLIEDASLRNFIISSGDKELFKITSESSDFLKNDNDFSSADCDREFKIMFDNFDGLNDESIMSDIFAPFSKSFTELRKEEFTQNYKNTRFLTSSVDPEKPFRNFRTFDRNAQLLEYKNDNHIITRKEGLRNFDKSNFYFENNDLSIESLDLNTSNLYKESIIKSEKIQSVKQKFHFLDLEISEMGAEVRNYITYLGSTVVSRDQRNRSWDPESNLKKAHIRQRTLISLDQKMKLAKYDAMTKIDQIKTKMLSNDVSEIQNLLFMVGTTLTDKIFEIKNVIGGEKSLENIISESDFGSESNLVTSYGIETRKYFIQLHKNIKFMLRHSLTDVLEQCDKHVQIVKQMDQAANSGELSEYEIALKHMTLIGQERKIVNFLNKNPSWNDITTNESPISWTHSNSSTSDGNQSNKYLENVDNRLNDSLKLDNLVDENPPPNLKKLNTYYHDKATFSFTSQASKIRSARVSSFDDDSTFVITKKSHNELQKLVNIFDQHSPLILPKNLKRKVTDSFIAVSPIRKKLKRKIDLSDFEISESQEA